jgi:hypothetical protein
MTIVEYKMSSDIGSMSARCERNNHKDRICFVVAKTVHVIWDETLSDKEKLKKVESMLVGLQY